MAEPRDPSERPERDETLAARTLGSGVRGARRIAGVTGVDRALDAAAEEAIVRAIESTAVERALMRLAEDGKLQRVLEEAAARTDSEELVRRAIDSEAADRIWAEILASDKAQMLVERVAEAPEVRVAIAQQGFGLVTDIGRRVNKVTEALDDAVERAVLGLLGPSEQHTETNQVGLISRIVAGAIDVALFSGLLSLISGLLASIASLAFGDINGLSALAVVGVWLLGFLVMGMIFVTFWSLVGQTPGMRFLGIRLDVDGSDEIGLRRSLKRLLAIPLSLLPGALGFLAIITSPQRHAWHDRIAGTAVVYDETKAPWSALSRDWTSGDQPPPVTPDGRSSMGIDT